MADTLDLKYDIGEFDSDSPVVTETEAIRILANRLPKGMNPYRYMKGAEGRHGKDYTSYEFSSDRSEMLRLAYNLIPEDLRTKDALLNMDLRPVFQHFLMSQGQGNEDGTSAVGDEDVRDSVRQLAGYTMVEMTESYKEMYENRETEKIGEGPDTDKAAQLDAISAQVDELLNGYRDGTVMRLPDAKGGGSYAIDPEGNLVANDGDALSEAISEDFNTDFDTAGEASIENRFLSGKDIQKMLAGGEITLDYLREVEQADMSGDPTATDPNAPRTLSHNARVTYTDERRQVAGNAPDHLSSSQDRGTEKDWYSVTEVLQLPSTFTPTQRVAMVKRLEQAGFLEKGAVLGGDTTSSQFKAAWKQLASSALERGVSMTSFLDSREQTYQETIMDSFATRLTDPARLRLSGNTLGQQTLGRKLTDEEHSEMIKFVHDLERRNAQVEAGLDATEGDENGMSPLDEGITADIDARMQEWIRDENAVEAGGEDIADQYEAFSRMLAGPGRGVG